MNEPTSTQPLAFRLNQLAGWGLIIGNLPLVVVCLFFAWDAFSLQRHGRAVLATVTHVEKSGSDLYQPSFGFTDHTGTRQSVTVGSYSSRWDFEVSEEIELIYDVRDPSRARPSGFLSEWFIPILTGVVWLVSTLVGVVMLVLGRVLSPRPSNAPVPTRGGVQSAGSN